MKTANRSNYFYSTLFILAVLCSAGCNQCNSSEEQSNVWIPYEDAEYQSGRLDCGDGVDLYTNETEFEEDIFYHFVVNCEFTGYWWVETGEENESPEEYEIQGYGGEDRGSVSLMPGETLVFQCTRGITVANEGCTWRYKVASYREVN